MLQSAIDAEVDAFIASHADRTDEQHRRLVLRNGSLPERNILSGAGSIPVTQGRVRDNHPDRTSGRIRSSAFLFGFELTDSILKLFDPLG